MFDAQRAALTASFVPGRRRSRVRGVSGARGNHASLDRRITPDSGGADLTLCHKSAEDRVLNHLADASGRGLDNVGMKRRLPLITAYLAVALAACSPALDWREFTPEGSGVKVSFPCRPDRHARAVVVAGASVRMEMLVCEAAGSTFAVGFFDVPDPTQVAVSLREIRATMLANVRGASPISGPAKVIGMTPNLQALRVSGAGQLPDGRAVQVDAAFFTRGLRVYQATLIGTRPQPQAIETFFDGLRLPF